MDIPQANFLTTAEFHRGPDLLRPSAYGRVVDPNAIAFIFCHFPYAGQEADIRVSDADPHFIYWPAAMGHERAIDREPVLVALFGPAFRETTAAATYEREVYDLTESGNPKTTAEGALVVVGKKVVFDPIELRRLAIRENLFGRHGTVRGTTCLMLWNECEGWGEKVERLLVLLGLTDEGLVTLRNTEQWWVRDFRMGK